MEEVLLLRRAYLWYEKDVFLCEPISASLFKSRCFFFDFAIDLNDFNLCERIEVANLRINCVRRFSNSDK
ncbi:MAG: hypothetical protein ACOX1V_00620 [Candidatus Iainarchaeum sp.]